MKIHQKDKVDIIKSYTINLEPMKDIAKRYEVTRQAIHKLLRKEGVKTAKGLNNTRFEVTCIACNKMFIRNRAYIRNHRHIFCSYECYYAFIEANQSRIYNQSRQGQRIARTKVSQFFNLQGSHIVHHEDGNQFNNSLDNLRVFLSQGDHIRYHRWSKDGTDVEPIWDGRNL